METETIQIFGVYYLALMGAGTSIVDCLGLKDTCRNPFRVVLKHHHDLTACLILVLFPSKMRALQLGTCNEYAPHLGPGYIGCGGLGFKR